MRPPNFLCYRYYNIIVKESQNDFRETQRGGIIMNAEKYTQKSQIVEVSCIEGATLAYAEIFVVPERK